MTGPFFEGHTDGLLGRRDATDDHETERERTKYRDGYAIGKEEREAGALEPDVDAL